MNKSYMNMLNRLEAFKSIKVSMLDIIEFIKFCNGFGVYPTTGAIEDDSAQWLHI